MPKEKESKSDKKVPKKDSKVRYAIIIFFVTLLVSSSIGLGSNIVIDQMESAWVVVVLLLAVILVGVIFDMMGTAVAVANPAPFHAKAARKIPSAKKALFLIGHADKVANVCNDVVGDICGVVSGGLSGAVVAVLFVNGNMLISVFVTALVAGITVMGKAIGKNVAINGADNIIWIVAEILSFPEKIFKKKKTKKK